MVVRSHLVREAFALHESLKTHVVMALHNGVAMPVVAAELRTNAFELVLAIFVSRLCLSRDLLDSLALGNVIFILELTDKIRLIGDALGAATWRTTMILDLRVSPVTA